MKEYVELLTDLPHWLFELTLVLLLDGIIGAVLWPYVKRHIHRDISDGPEAKQTTRVRRGSPYPQDVTRRVPELRTKRDRWVPHISARSDAEWAQYSALSASYREPRRSTTVDGVTVFVRSCCSDGRGTDAKHDCHCAGQGA